MESNDQLSLTTLPLDLQLCIRSELLQDPETTFEDFRTLRLVCKAFDALYAPIVLSAIQLFKNATLSSGLMQIHDLMVGSDSLEHSAKTITIAGWRWIYGSPSFISVRQMRMPGWLLPGICLNVTVLPICYVLRCVFRADEIPRRFINMINRARARRCVSRLPDKVKFPNVRCVKWRIAYAERDWIVSRTLQLLLAFPQLTELELVLPVYHNVRNLADCLTALRNLRKLTIETTFDSKLRSPSPQNINGFQKLIACNPFLTHLILVQPGIGGQGCLFELMGDVPSYRPLALQHLGLSDNFSNPFAILPHLTCLTSLDVRSTRWGTDFWQLLDAAKIYPSEIKTDCIDGQLITYLKHHPNLVTLSADCPYKKVIGYLLLQALAQHPHTLQNFSSDSRSLCRCLQFVEDETLFMKFTGLRQLGLLLRSDIAFVDSPSELSFEFVHMLRIIARFGNLQTLAINNKPIFDACIARCRDLQNPLLRTLCNRIALGTL
ncbi:hypothetical protein AX17_002946 [Amanita inopinata Kibby_2008]|nr:hypothetical protein AX17_002946 [Amanita inopinata Kibby_2008]